MGIERFKGLIAIQQMIGEARGDLQAVMDAIVNEYAVMPQCNGIVVELRDGDQLYYAAASGTSAALIGLRLALSSSLSGQCILEGVPLQCDDAMNDDRVNREACERVGLRSMIVVPIPHQGQTVGVLKFHSDKVADFGEEDMLIAHLLVGPIAVGFSSIGEADAIRAKADLQSVVNLKDQLVSVVSHELRTPVTSMKKSLGLLLGGLGGDLSAQAISLIEIASRNADRLRKLVDDLLDLDRLDAGKLSIALEPTDLRDVVRDVVTEANGFAGRAGVTLLLEEPDGPLMLETDKDRLFQAVTNLVSNAAKFSPEGGRVTIALAEEGGAANIRVSDEGPGVPVDFRSRLFDRFTQSDAVQQSPRFTGTGLGLAISKGIVRQLGGTIRLDEAVAQGATFEISLPLDAATQS